MSAEESSSQLRRCGAPDLSPNGRVKLLQVIEIGAWYGK